MGSFPLSHRVSVGGRFLGAQFLIFEDSTSKFHLLVQRTHNYKRQFTLFHFLLWFFFFIIPNDWKSLVGQNWLNVFMLRKKNLLNFYQAPNSTVWSFLLRVCLRGQERGTRGRKAVGQEHGDSGTHVIWRRRSGEVYMAIGEARKLRGKWAQTRNN